MKNPLRLALTIGLSAGLGIALYSRAEVVTGPIPIYGAPAAVVNSQEVKGPYRQGKVVTVAPAIAPVPAETTHQVRLDITHKVVEVAPGVKFKAWTFGDTVPGPVIHVRQGDKVEFSMANRTHQTTGVMMPMPHSIDFHAAMVNPGDKYRTIAAGQVLGFSWTANYPGVFMYHCATPPVLQHLAMGMYGAVVVDPAGGWPHKVDREYVVVQSEFYLKRQKDGTYDFDLIAINQKNPSQVAFNGSTTRHKNKPLLAKTGERVRLYVLNVGPSDTSSFHVIGTIFDSVYVDGNPRNELTGLQTILLGASSGAVVEFVVPEDGTYPMVDHEFTDAAKGAVGIISTGTKTAASGDHGH